MFDNLDERLQIPETGPAGVFVLKLRAVGYFLTFEHLSLSVGAK